MEGRDGGSGNCGSDGCVYSIHIMLVRLTLKAGKDLGLVSCTLVGYSGH